MDLDSSIINWMNNWLSNHNQKMLINESMLTRTKGEENQYLCSIYTVLSAFPASFPFILIAPFYR